jgi:tetratricopeptide (TPR) repeat protein
LAIELAAARVKSLSVEKIAERLDDRFRLLTGGSRTALPRQQTLRSMIDWSHSLLSEPERILFRRLSVFAGGWTLEAAEKVCADENELSLYDVLDLLTRLIDKSLFILNCSRYEVLETTRQFAREKLLDSEEVEMLRNQHLDYFLTLARQADREIHGPVQATWIDRLDMEVDNFRTALEWCMLEQNTESALCLLGALVWPWSMRGRFRETHSWFDKIRTLSNVMDYPVPYAKLLNRMGGLQIWLTGDLRYAESLLQESQAIWLNLGIDGERDLAQTLDCLGAIALFSEGDLKTAESFFKHSFRLYQEHGDQSGMAWEVYDLGLLALEQNHYAEAERLFMESLAKFQELGEKFKAATLFNGLGELARLQGDYERAGKFYEQNLEIIRELDSPFTLEYTLNNLAWVSLRGGDFRKAQTMLKESIKLSYDQGNRSGIPVCLAGFASILGMIGKPEQAARLFGAVESIKNSFGKDMDPPDQKEFEHYVAVVRAQLDEAAFSKAWAEYQSITIEQAIALALEETYE